MKTSSIMLAASIALALLSSPTIAREPAEPREPRVGHEYPADPEYRPRHWICEGTLDECVKPRWECTNDDGDRIVCKRPKLECDIFERCINPIEHCEHVGGCGPEERPDPFDKWERKMPKEPKDRL